MTTLASRNRRLTYLLLLVLTFLVAPSVYADKDKDRREWEKERREAYREAQKEHREAMKARRRHGGYLDDRYDRDRRFEDSRNSARRMGVSQGYRDGYEKGQEDYRKNRTADLYRHERYRDADHGYKGKYGDKTSYEQGYRQGFENGYDEGFIRFVRNRY